MSAGPTLRARAVPLGWWDAALDWAQQLRDRWLASPVFQRRAAACRLTRPVARRHARELFDLVAGFVYSQVLRACVQLRLFDLLAAQPQTLEDLAPKLGLPPQATQRLLAAAVSLRLVVHRRGGRYGLGPLGAPLVGHTAIAAMVQHHAALYADLADPVALLRGPAGASAVARYWPYAGADAPQRLDPARVAAYSDLMAASQPLVAEQVLQAYPLARHRVLLDVGGGDGSFAAAAARQCPPLRVMLFDLPGVAERARRRFAAEGLAQRASAHGGSFFADPLPPGADVVSLVRVIHDHDDEAALQILRAAHRALEPGGVLLLAEPLSGTPGAEPMGDAYFGFYLLAMGQGRPRTAAELGAMLQQAGFVAVRTLETNLPLQTGLLVASRGPA